LTKSRRKSREDSLEKSSLDFSSHQFHPDCGHDGLSSQVHCSGRRWLGKQIEGYREQSVGRVRQGPVFEGEVDVAWNNCRKEKKTETVVTLFLKQLYTVNSYNFSPFVFVISVNDHGLKSKDWTNLIFFFKTRH
jgi:hypothetical protein